MQALLKLISSKKKVKIMLEKHTLVARKLMVPQGGDKQFSKMHAEEKFKILLLRAAKLAQIFFFAYFSLRRIHFFLDSSQLYAK